MNITLFNNKIITYWRCYNLGAFELSDGESNALLILPDRRTIGGYQLNDSTKHLYFTTGIYNDWDGCSNPKIFVFWECNINNTRGRIRDKVNLKIICHIKGVSESVIRFQSLKKSMIVGQSPRYKQFVSEFILDYDNVLNPININDSLSFNLFLKTDTSDVKNIIVNRISFKYKARKPDIEIE